MLGADLERGAQVGIITAEAMAAVFFGADDVPIDADAEELPEADVCELDSSR